MSKRSRYNNKTQSNLRTGHVAPPCGKIVDSSAAAMPMADESNHSTAGTLHQYHSAMHFCTAMPQTPYWLQWGTPHLPPKLPLPMDDP